MQSRDHCELQLVEVANSSIDSKSFIESIVLAKHAKFYGESGIVSATEKYLK
jgi:hypothetical protein